MIPRQSLPNVYIRNGAIYLIKTEVLLKNKSLVSKLNTYYLMNDFDSINIDEKIGLIGGTRYGGEMKKGIFNTPTRVRETEALNEF